MKFNTSRNPVFRKALAATLIGAALSASMCGAANAQSIPMQCADPVAQNPTKIFRSGLWKQWIYWAIPGPTAFAAVKRIVAEVNVSRASAGLPLLVAVPGYEIVVSVFDERNARGANGSSALPVTANQEAFLATFVDDTAGGSEVLFLTDPMRSNSILTTAKSVPGVAATIQRGIAYEMENGVDKVETEWQISTAAGDKIEFSASYPETAAYFHSVSPASRIDYANCNLTHFSDIVYRSTPNKTYPLFARDAGNYLDAAQSDVHVKVRVKHHDPDVNAIFNDKANVPEILIAADRDVRIESR
jgi:hypothetical protein